jgi:hypothetical protein
MSAKSLCSRSLRVPIRLATLMNVPLRPRGCSGRGHSANRDWQTQTQRQVRDNLVRTRADQRRIRGANVQLAARLDRVDCMVTARTLCDAAPRMSTSPARKPDLRTVATRLTRTLGPFACIAALLCAVWVGGARPRQRMHFCDDQEYLTMSTSFVLHGSPEFRVGDDVATLNALPLKWRRQMYRKFAFGAAPTSYFASRTGQWFGYHFFTYPAAVAPLRAWLDGGAHAARAHQYTNLLVFSFALVSLLALRSQPALFWTITPLAFLTPVLWFTAYASTESFVFSLGLLALSCRLTDRIVLAILFNSIAATQYQPLAPLSLLMCGQWLWSQRAQLGRQVPRALGAIASAALVFVPGLFYFIQYGTPNLIAREGLVSMHFVAFGKFVGLFTDLNGGLFLYAPGVSLVLLVASVGALWRLRTRHQVSGVLLLGCVLFSMFASTVQRNWNHPTFGISRYALYGIAPALLFVGQELRQHTPAPKLLVGLVIVALGLQLMVHQAFGYFEYRGNDSAHHSPLARYVLERWPKYYTPHPEIFCERAKRQCWPDPLTGEPLPDALPVIWRDSRGTARKILATRCDAAKLLRAAAWSDAERATIQAAMRDCKGRGTLYIDL